MSYQTTPAESNALSLDEVLARLAKNQIVEGVLTIGTTSDNRLSPSSDYDIVIVVPSLGDLEPYGVTHIDGRLTDLLFVTTAQLEEILALTEPVDSRDWLGRIIRWFEGGTIAFDREGRLRAVRHKVRTVSCLLPLDNDARAGWWRVNYNLAQTRRMLAADDPVYLIAADLRMALYGPTDLLFNYFDIRNLPWSGDKDAVRYLCANDRDYLDLFRRFIAEGDRSRKIALYQALALHTVAPVGGLWEEGTTALASRQTDSESGRALDFWDDLIR
ncbi:MAG: hypothetical protein JXC32_16745 [Anaerolineae bacterium]|nr:hypothetical protein [Anaerolineae bacterium]